MKPFNNIAVSPTQPENKADVWIKHNYIKYNGGWQNITYGTSGEVQSNSKRLASDKIKLEKGVYKLDNPNNEEISPVAIAKFNEDSFVELKANIKFPYELVIDDTFNQISVVFKKANETVITSGDVKNFEILSLQEDDILVNDNGVYNSVVIQNITTGVEFKTKKVIDGHQIYAKYIDLGQLPSSAQSKWINIGIDFKNILNYYVKMTDQNSTLFMPVFSSSSDSYIYCYFNGTNIVIVVAKDRSAFSATLYIEYFKD